MKAIPIIQPLTTPASAADTSVNGFIQSAGSEGVVLTQNEGALNELFTYDTNLEKVFGASPLVTDQRLDTNVRFTDRTVKGRLGAANEALGINCQGFPSVLVQISGVWVGTITFEATADGGNYQTINGLAPNASALVTTSTTNAVYRFNTAGHVRFQCRFSAYTSGTALITLIASGEQGSVMLSNNVQGILGSQNQALAQKATTYELNTVDTNLGRLLGDAVATVAPIASAMSLTRPAQEPQPIAPPLPIIAAPSVANAFLAKQPQYYARLRVEAGGDQKLPFAQDNLTNRLKVQYDEGTSLLEQILIQLKLLNQNTMIVNGITPPAGWEEIN